MRRTVTRSIVAVLAVIMAGCTTVEPSSPPLRGATSRYVLEVEPGVDRIALAVHENGLSSNQHAALAALAGRFAQAQAEVIRVEAPSGDDPVSAQAAWAMRDALSSLGVPAERVLVMAYDAPNPRAPVLAGFEILRARIPDCAQDRRALGANYSNQTSAGFGCAITANLAAQIANPRDIVGPAGLQPADSSRRAKVFETYRAGTPTSAPQEQLIDGRISQAVE